eukprot:gene18984-19329_t
MIESNFAAKSTDGGLTWTSMNAFSSDSTTSVGSIYVPHSISMASSSVAFIATFCWRYFRSFIFFISKANCESYDSPDLSSDVLPNFLSKRAANA